MIYQGDCLDILPNLAGGSIDLIYLDPPYFSQKDYGDFNDKWESIEVYISWMEERVIEMYRVLKSTGSFYLHCDHHASHYLKVMVDRIFGYNQFRNEIIWSYPDSPGRATKWFSRKHDVILFYSRGDKYTINIDDVRVPILEKSKERYNYTRELGGKKYLGGEAAEIGKVPEDVWRIPVVKGNSAETCGYPTQKPLALLERIIKASSNPGDIVLDPFCGGGTTCVAAEKLGRKYIGIDTNPRAIKLAWERLGKGLA